MVAVPFRTPVGLSAQIFPVNASEGNLCYFESSVMVPAGGLC